MAATLSPFLSATSTSLVTRCANPAATSFAGNSRSLSLPAPSFGDRVEERIIEKSRARSFRVQVRAETESKGLARSGVGQGGRWLSCTTRHIRIYAGYIDPVSFNMDQSQLDKLSIMVDPDDEFLWTDEQLQKVYGKFSELVEGYAGAPLTEYTLRLIGSDLEHFIRRMLLDGEIKYNLNCRVLNFSMGKPYYRGMDIEAEIK
eukprot:TRINITY_DN388_c0_g1_i4.p1 TRINITY_DN388_c0_g1~~TRINITY_DN388_c0_g1_i4.p1  ORF type:complete len:203 (+),score=34.52 TRINITY_DN388_c0_g1_i4:3-611(+)